jgi:hypothetical protein
MRAAGKLDPSVQKYSLIVVEKVLLSGIAEG